MNLLLDTHVFLWLRLTPDKISPKILDAYYDINNEVFLSMASIWEIQIKFQLGKLELSLPLNQLIQEQRINNGLLILPIETDHIYALNELPRHHNDPFDRMILAQAKLENLHLVSADTVFSHYDVDLIW
ncbi:PilT-like protein [Methyloglobulus morosus KoM1]|uniref:PilT-like protein n=1 Tax=Methyloglobulus morosus KoM1 TaxID=1116472 RepID=V5DVA7_9GAMM|nr:type II toxin-antitoxin system VapC family toxin [Methyloglobulus morosus]ESS71341.1 PilT-like protein [Methyloglobulus morosus KoM1]